MTAQAEETCAHVINFWIARHGCPITFHSDNGKAFVGKPTKELIKRSQVAQALATIYHPQTIGLDGAKPHTSLNVKGLWLRIHERLV